MITQCPCQHCQGLIEFEPERNAETVACPHCGLETVLTASAKATPGPQEHLTIRCPGCQSEVSVSKRDIGLRLSCPHCQQEFVLEGDTPSSEPPPLESGNVPLPTPQKIPFFGFQKRKLLEEHFSHLVADGELSEADERHLEGLTIRLGLSETEAHNVHSKLYHAALAPLKMKMETSAYVTDEDMEVLEELKRRFKAKFEFDSTFLFARWRFLLDERDALPPLQNPGFMTKPGEGTYGAFETEWAQFHRNSSGYVGIGTSIRLAKGVELSLGRALPVSSEELTPLRSGSPYVTDYRILFAGSARSTTILLGRIVGVEVIADALQISKDRGKPDCFSMGGFYAAYVRSLVSALCRRMK